MKENNIKSVGRDGVRDTAGRICRKVWEAVLPKKLREMNRVFRESVLEGYNAYKKVLSNKFFKPDTRIYFMDYGGSGDIFLCCSYLAQKNQILNNDVLVAAGSVVSRVASYFNFSYIVEITVQEAWDLRIMDRFIKKPIKVLPLLYESVPLRYSGILRHMQGYKGLNFSRLLRIGIESNLNILDDFDRIIPYRFYCEKSELEALKEKLGLKYQRIALLSPYMSHSNMREIPMAFWQQIAKYLIEKGFKVYTNSCDEKKEKIIPETIRLCLPYHLITSIMDEGGGVFVGIRSGLCDILSTAVHCKKIVLYPKWKIAEGVSTWKEFFSMKDMKLSDNVVELEYKNKNQNWLEMITNVINIIEKENYVE